MYAFWLDSGEYPREEITLRGDTKPLKCKFPYKQTNENHMAPQKGYSAGSETATNENNFKLSER